MRLHLFGWPRLKPPWGLSAVVRERAKKSAEGYLIDEYYLPDLGATERDPELHMLWSHCMRSQITPDALKRVQRKHLEYLAAHSGDVFLVVEKTLHGDDVKDVPPRVIKQHNVKLQANAVRATYELERRDRVRGVITTTFIAAAIGAIVGGLFASGIWL